MLSEGRRCVDAEVIGESPTIYLDLGESMLDFFKLMLVVIQSLLLRDFRS